MNHLGDYDVIVIGAGHAGIEAAHAAAILGAKTAVFTMSLDAIGNMPCNPSIGGTAKGTLVRELDALGGVMGLAADATYLQSRMLNKGKGPAVHALRVQTDRKRYHEYMKHALELTPGLAIHQAEIISIEVEDGHVKGVVTQLNGEYGAKCVVITVCLEDSIILRSIAEGAVKGVHTALRTRFVFQILLRIAGRFLKNLRMIERDFTRIEKRLYDSLKNEELIQLLGLSKSLVYFSSSLKGNEVTMEKVLRGRVLKLYEDDRDILEDALIEVRQAIEMANIYSNIMAGTMDAYASVVSNNLNIIMKVLTILTIIMTIPNIVFGFFGMNIGEGRIPGDWIWWMPLAITVVGCFFAWYMLKKKNLD